MVYPDVGYTLLPMTLADYLAIHDITEIGRAHV